MVKASLVTISLVLLALFSGCLGQRRMAETRVGNECQIDEITALEPTQRIQAEAGLTEIWDSSDQQFRCSGVTLIRRTIERNGLLLPSYSSSPELVYIEQGEAMTGLLIPGCPETYQSLSQGQIREENQQGGSEELSRYEDLHQKVTHLRQGDVIALPAGFARWVYNVGDEPLVAVILLDNTNEANQLDQDFPWRFYLAGNPEPEHPQHHHQQSSRRGGQQESSGGNIMSGFSTRLLAEVLGIDEETARQIQGEGDERGNIVRVEGGLQVIRPPAASTRHQRSERRSPRHPYGSNGLEETICSAQLHVNVDDSERSDVYNPEAGRLTSVNSYTLPILQLLRLSAEKGVLYREAIVGPKYTMNAHDIIYGVRGRAQIQIVNERGDTIFNDELRQGQVVVVPQNFAVAKQTNQDEGFEYISFKTNENAMVQTLSGRTSAIRAMPQEIIANMYQISSEQARRLKYGRQETMIFSSSRGRRAVA